MRFSEEPTRVSRKGRPYPGTNRDHLRRFGRGDHVTCWINPHSTDKSLTSPPERVLYRSPWWPMAVALVLIKVLTGLFLR